MSPSLEQIWAAKQLYPLAGLDSCLRPNYLTFRDCSLIEVGPDGSAQRENQRLQLNAKFLDPITAATSALKRSSSIVPTWPTITLTQHRGEVIDQV